MYARTGIVQVTYVLQDGKFLRYCWTSSCVAGKWNDGSYSGSVGMYKRSRRVYTIGVD